MHSGRLLVAAESPVCQGHHSVNGTAATMMICDRFAFVHLHKSGGTFVNELMLRCLPNARRIGYHLPYAELPGEFRSLPVLGAVRNPLAYYVSWYHFQQQMPAERRNALFNVCSDMAARDFAGTIDNLVMLHDRPELVDRLIAAFPEDYQSFGLNLTKSCIRRITGSTHGFYAFLYHRMYKDADPTILPMEQLRSALGGYLEAAYPGGDRPWAAFLAGAPDLNTSRHGAFREYYPAALRATVERFDAEVFAAHGY